MATDLPSFKECSLLRYMCSRCTNYAFIESKEGDTLDKHLNMLKWRVDYNQYPTRLLVCDVCETVKYLATYGHFNGLHDSVAYIENELLEKKGRVTESKKAQLREIIKQWKEALIAINIPVLSHSGRELAVRKAEGKRSAFISFVATQLS